MSIRVELVGGRAVTGALTPLQEEDFADFMKGDAELPTWLDLLGDDARVICVNTRLAETITELPG